MVVQMVVVVGVVVVGGAVMDGVVGDQAWRGVVEVGQRLQLVRLRAAGVVRRRGAEGGLGESVDGFVHPLPRRGPAAVGGGPVELAEASLRPHHPQQRLEKEGGVDPAH